MEAVVKTVEDKDERKQLLEGLLGFIISCTQVYIILQLTVVSFERVTSYNTLI